MKHPFFRVHVFLLVVLTLFSAALAISAQTASSTPAEPSTQPEQAAPEKQTPTQTSKPKKPKAPKPKQPALTRTLDTRLSGFTSHDADQIYARLSVSEKRGGREWHIRGSFSRTATNVSNKSSRVSTYKLDSRIERARSDRKFNVLTGVVSIRERNPASRNRLGKSGYEFVSYGIGRQLGRRSKGDIGLGLLKTYDTTNSTSPAVVASIRGRRPLSKKLTFDSDILALQPTESLRSTKVDSDLGLSYELAPGFYLRLGWQATNLIRPVRGNREWDSVVRLSISFRRTTRK